MTSRIATQYKRICPNCSKQLFYSSYHSWRNAIHRNRNCASCAQSARCKRPGESILRSQRAPKQFGKDNHFYGKKHSKTIITLLQVLGREAQKLKKEHKSLYDYWIAKYPKEEADRRLEEWKRKLSIRQSGKNNNMYGKPPPPGSGNGWSGWYKGWYFRSLLELSYVVSVIERNDLSWCSAERSDLCIKYLDWNGKVRNYFADFFVESNILIECKPKPLHTAPRVLLKQKAAIQFCNKKGYIYQLVDCEPITESEIAIMHSSGLIKFTARYEEKFAEKFAERRRKVENLDNPPKN